MRGVIDTMDSLITGPTLEPLDLEEVKKQRRFAATTLDTLFDLWIAAARQHFEEYTGRQLISAVWEYWLDAFPEDAEIEIPHPPLQEILSVKYDDGAGDEQTLDAASYRVIAPQGPYGARGRVAVAIGSTWPTTAAHAKAVRIQYRAGCGDTPADVPELVQYALMLLVGHFHKFGEEVQDAKSALVSLPLGAKLVMDGWKYSALPVLPPRSSTWPV